jgi:Leucine-rich repeat (LRR) protein
LITKIEGIEHNLELVRINLQNNRVEKAENLKHLPQLVHFDISKNAVKSMEDLEELKECPMIQSLDIHGNQIEDQENYIPFMEQMKAVISI